MAPTFALKGGTAMNLFVRDMPRLSVDLDLVFPDYALSREEALKRINDAIRQTKTLPGRNSLSRSLCGTMANAPTVSGIGFASP
jgi:predicted nucleotidyltransferase component of viral defense system